MKNEENSTGQIDSIEDDVAFGSFTSGPLTGKTCDLPVEYSKEGRGFTIQVGDTIIAQLEFNSIIVIQSDVALVLQFEQTPEGLEISAFEMFDKNKPDETVSQ